MQIFNQPVAWPQYAFRHVAVVKMACWGSNQASESGKKGDLRDFVAFLFVVVKRTGQGSFAAADLRRFINRNPQMAPKINTHHEYQSINTYILLAK